MLLIKINKDVYEFAKKKLSSESKLFDVCYTVYSTPSVIRTPPFVISKIGVRMSEIVRISEIRILRS